MSKNLSGCSNFYNSSRLKTTIAMLLALHSKKRAASSAKPQLILLVALFFFNALAAQTNFIDPQTPEQAQPVLTNVTAPWQLQFSDEFNDSTIDLSKWTVQESPRSRGTRTGLGISSWFWKPDNAFEENGNLVLRVDKVSSDQMHCGSINSNDKYETQYGYYECRVKIAQASKGTHTAFWFQGDGQGLIDGTANDGAEIDVVESAWLEDYTKAVLHIDGYGSSTQANTKQYTTPGIHEGYHTFGMLWTPTYINIYYDGVLKTSFTGDKWKVNAPEFIWLSDGASFGFSGDNFTVEPIGELTRAYFDYVRVWQLSDYECFMASKEMEALPYTATGATASVLANTSASGGQVLRLAADGTGDELMLGPVCHPEAGYYSYDLRAFKFTSFGKYKLSIETAPGVWQMFDQELDLYGSSASVTTNFGSVYLPAGSYRMKLTCTGKNSSSTGYFGSFDLLTLQPGVPDISCFTPADPVTLWSGEAESGTYSGSAALQNCATASNGQYINLNAISTKRLTLSDVTVPTAGKYLLKIDYVAADNNRKARVEVNASSTTAVNFPSSGAWCFDGGSPGSLMVLVTLNAGTNSIALLNNSSSLLPLFDKLTVLSTNVDTDGDGVPDTCDSDDDNDRIPDASDNCPLTSNPGQADADGDGLGDECDSDDDNDSILDSTDNCPLTANSGQEDTDNDGTGNECDSVFNTPGFTNKLSANIDTMESNRGIQTALKASLNAALAQCQQGNRTATVNELNAFIQKAQAMSGGQITADFANYLIASATYAIQAINNGQSDCGVPTVTSQQQLGNGFDVEKPNNRFRVYPNPVIGGATFNLFIPQNNNGRQQVLQIIETSTGRMVYTKTFSADARIYKLNHRLAGGAYVARLLGNAAAAPIKFEALQ